MLELLQALPSPRHFSMPRASRFAEYFGCQVFLISILLGLPNKVGREIIHSHSPSRTVPRISLTTCSHLMASIASCWRLFIIIIAAFAATALADFVSRTDPTHIASKRQEAIQRWSQSIRQHDKGFSKRVSPGVKNITFSNPQASQFYVDGSTIPEVDYDIGPSWSGLLPISGKPNETRKLFFWFFPPGPGGSLDDLIFWYDAYESLMTRNVLMFYQCRTNGGPGCSSLEGAFQENGVRTFVARNQGVGCLPIRSL
jgi:hypothetical protein